MNTSSETSGSGKTAVPAGGSVRYFGPLRTEIPGRVRPERLRQRAADPPIRLAGPVKKAAARANSENERGWNRRSFNAGQIARSALRFRARAGGVLSKIEAEVVRLAVAIAPRSCIARRNWTACCWRRGPRWRWRALQQRSELVVRVPLAAERAVARLFSQSKQIGGEPRDRGR